MRLDDEDYEHHNFVLQQKVEAALAEFLTDTGTTDTMILAWSLGVQYRWVSGDDGAGVFTSEGISPNARLGLGAMMYSTADEECRDWWRGILHGDN